ncbi:MAG: Acetyl-CoA:oxalate CoA-transferase [Alphaproteobacteria bacterium MarineAlpha2_Bin1]|nr:MAG: Acetyl-CoA:oxalate CoA-transferase [Alphaproteobacteria bacterium MarineAlpha2_Bin1]|tara:strand:+ start:359 stop:1567 length:1209 start_codon:yes stop_codon:yes gene_type:complete
MKKNKNKTNGPIQGIKILDMSRVLGGPYCTQLLGDMGASIIKLEPPQGDETRDWGPPFKNGEAAYFMGVNRNKDSISLDISKPVGKKILYKLLEDTDVLVENFKPGTMEKWNIGFDELKKTFPKLVHCRVSGFGSGGPLGGLPGYDALLQAMCGWFSVNGEPKSEGVRMGIPLIDLGTGLFASNAILAALIEREKSGIGQFVEVTLFDTGIALQHPHAANWFVSKKQPERVGNAHTNIAPYDSFPTRTIPIYMSVGNDRQFKILCETLGNIDLASDERFLNNAQRVKNKSKLRNILIKLLSEKDGLKISNKLLKLGVPAGPILDMQGILNHEHTQNRNMIVKKDNYYGLGIPIKFQRTPGSIRKKPPTFAEDTERVFNSVNISKKEISELIKKKIIFTKRKK